jgi:hypothetical protein
MEGRFGQPAFVEGAVTMDVKQLPRPEVQDNGGLSLQIDEALARLRKLGIRVPCPSEVREYLLSYPDTVGALEQIGEVAAAEMGSTTELTLELYRDAEAADEYLTIYARQAEYQDTDLDEIDRVRELYEPYITGVSGWILLAPDYRPVAA